MLVDDYRLYKVLDKIKEIIDTEKFNDTKILIDTADKLPDHIILQNVLILITYVMKVDDKFYQELFLDYALCDE